MEQVNVFTNGIDIDSSPAFLQEGRYRHMLNGDIYLEERAGKGVAINANGNDLIRIEWPTDNTSLISTTNPYDPKWKIYKGLLDRKDIILIYVDTDDTGNVKIDLLKYKEEELYLRIHLIEEIYVGITSEYKVDGFINRETDDLVKLYFYSKGLNNNTRIKHLNIAPDIINRVLQDPLLQSSYTTVNALTLEELEMLPITTGISATTYSYIEGSLRVGAYMYYLRVIDNGVKSAWIKLTDIIYVSNFIDKDSFATIRGDFSTNDTGFIFSNKGIELNSITLNNRVQIARSWYSEFEGLPETYIIYEGKFNSGIRDTSYDSVLNSVDYGELSLSSYLIAPKTHAVKDNVLFLGNVEEEYFDVSIDTRAYRFFEGQAAIISNGITSYIDASNPDWNIAEDADVINPYNEDASIKYMHTIDGGWIGGNGPYVSYRLIPTLIEVGKEDGNYNQTFSKPHANLLQLDEIYRVGVVFYDKYLRRTPVKWVGDIRTPKHSDLNIGVTTLFQSVGVRLSLEINLSTFPKLQGGFASLAVVKRDTINRRVLYEGIGLATNYDDRRPGVSLVPSFSSYHPFVDNNEGCAGNILPTEGVMLFYSPEISVFKTASVKGLKIEQIGVIKDNSGSAYLLVGNGLYVAYHSLGSDNAITPVAVYPNQSYISNSSFNSVDIINARIVTSGASVQLDEFSICNKVVDWIMSPIWDRTPQGDGATCLAIKYEGFVTDINTDEVGYFSIIRDSYPYGGGSYNSRLQSIYNIVGDIEPVIEDFGRHVILKYWGDVFAGVFELQRVLNPYELNNENDYKFTELVVYPTVSTVNLRALVSDGASTMGGLRYHTTIAEIREEGNYLLDDGTAVGYGPLYQYNSVFSQVLSGSLAVSDDLSLTKLNKFNNKVIYSNTKVNGDKLDSFLDFKVNNFNFIDSDKGSINYMVSKNNNVYVLQDSGFSVARINVRTQVPQDDGTALLIGVGTVLDGFTYISDTIGTQGVNEAVTSVSFIYFMDSYKNKIYRFGNTLDSVGDIMNISSYISKIINNNTIFLGAYDNERSNMILTIINEVDGTIYDDALFTVISKPIIGGIEYIRIQGDDSKVELFLDNIYELSDGVHIGEYLLANRSYDLSYDFKYLSGYSFQIADLIDMTKYILYPDSTTLKISEPLNAVVSFMSYLPSIYIPSYKKFYSSNDRHEIYTHEEDIRRKGKYYEQTPKPFTVTYSLNSLPLFNKQIAALSLNSKTFYNQLDYSNKFSYLAIENKTIDEIALFGERSNTEYIPLYSKNAEVNSEFISAAYTDNIDPAVYTSTERVIYEAEGVRIKPYPNYLYNVRHTLNYFNLAVPRLKTTQVDEDGRVVTELLRGKEIRVKLIHNNSIGTNEIRLYNTVTYYLTSVDI